MTNKGNRFEFHIMKNSVIGVLCVLLLLTGCGVNRQAKELKALGDCKYDLKSVDSIYVAGVPFQRLINQDNLDLSSVPALALGFLRKNIPFEGRVNLSIENPTGNHAAINQFEYIVLLQQKEVVQGIVNQKINVAAGEKAQVPISIKANIYNLLSDGSLEEVFNILRSDNSSNSEGLLTVKIKPIIFIGNTPIKYPGYITIDKKISRDILL